MVLKRASPIKIDGSKWGRVQVVDGEEVKATFTYRLKNLLSYNKAKEDAEAYIRAAKSVSDETSDKV